LDIATIYANNFSSFGMKNWHSSLTDNIKILEGQDLVQTSFEQYQTGFKPRITGLEEYILDSNVEWKAVHPAGIDREEITVKGRAIGGCLDVLLNLVGTRFDKTREFIHRYQEDGILWFLESFDLNSEALVRGLWQLKEAGWFEHTCGFLFGRPAMFGTSSDTSYEEAVLSVLKDFQVPIILDMDIGHQTPQLTMINGAIACVNNTGKKGSISFERR
jgi:muramoyltetrapeptide carboxypeptidase LdcA involved in peptidoglycan recycling